MRDVRDSVRTAYHHLAQARIDCERYLADLFPIGSTVEYQHSLREVTADVIGHDLQNWRLQVKDRETGWVGCVTVSRMAKVDAPPKIITLNG